MPEIPRRILYPTRAIRRKNIGEILLWAAVQKDCDEFWVTLAPENPRERPIYDYWVGLSEELNLPIVFEAVDRKPFPELVAECSHFITTSVSEGFGLAFLEGWLADRPLLGRKLPEITTDFESAGVDLSGLYDAVRVPIGWIDLPKFDTKLRMALQRSADAYGIQYSEDRFNSAKAFLISGDHVDFGRLDEELQSDVIRHLARCPADTPLIDPCVLTPPEPPGRTAGNRDRISEIYSPDRYHDRLLRLYRSLSETVASPVTRLDALSVLHAFLEPERVNLLRS